MRFIYAFLMLSFLSGNLLAQSLEEQVRNQASERSSQMAVGAKIRANSYIISCAQLSLGRSFVFYKKNVYLGYSAKTMSDSELFNLVKGTGTHDRYKFANNIITWGDGTFETFEFHTDTNKIYYKEPAGITSDTCTVLSGNKNSL